MSMILLQMRLLRSALSRLWYATAILADADDIPRHDYSVEHGLQHVWYPVIFVFCIFVSLI